ncbi:MAG: hypothetical protein AAGD13_19560 [Pseudomonadota bacterium]
MTKDIHQPSEIAESRLDDISGGPHFRNFHSSGFDFAPTAQTASSPTLGNDTGGAEIDDSSGTRTAFKPKPMAWDNVKN